MLSTNISNNWEPSSIPAVFSALKTLLLRLHSEEKRKFLLHRSDTDPNRELTWNVRLLVDSTSYWVFGGEPGEMENGCASWKNQEFQTEH